jgi:hypothetical protein
MGGVRIYDRSCPTSLWLAAQGEPEALAPGAPISAVATAPTFKPGDRVRWSRHTGTVQRAVGDVADCPAGRSRGSVAGLVRG